MKHISQILKKALQCLMTLSLLLVLSCEKESDISNTIEGITITINISTPNLSLETKSPTAQNLQENKIERVRVYAFDGSTGALLRMAYQPNTTHGTTKVSIDLTSLTAVTFFAVINEPEKSAIKIALDGVRSATDLNHIKYEIADYFVNNSGGAFVEGTTGPEYCLPMTGELTVEHLVDHSSVDIKAIRCVSRVDVYLRKLGPAPEQTLPALPVRIIPTTTFNISNVGTTSFLFDAARQDETSNNKSCTGGVNAIDLPKKTDNTDKSDYVKAFWFYTPQRTHSTKKMAYTITGLQYGNTALEILNSNPVALLRDISTISRNNIYKVYCTVGGREVTVDNTNITTNWEENGVDVNINKPNVPLIIDQNIALDWWANGKTFTKDIHYSANMDVKVYIGDISNSLSVSTEATPGRLDIGNDFPWLESVTWSKTEDKSGYIRFLYKIDGSAPKKDIIISIVYEEIVHKLNVSYDNGYISPEKLPNLTERGTWAPSGIHFAKRGSTIHENHPTPIAPSEDSGLFDWSGPINKAGLPTANVESSTATTSYGGGIKNTNAMVMVSYDPANATYGQAAHYCRWLGSKWYFPNSKEFEYILHNLKTSLGPSYTFSGTNNGISRYWCSSAHGAVNTSGNELQTVIDPNNNSITGEIITSTFYVRCIRDL